MAKAALFTFGVLRGVQGDPQVQEFFDRLALTYAAAEQCDGFIDRSRLDPVSGLHDWGERLPSRFVPAGENPHTPRTLSLWQDLESMFAFVYAGVHAYALRHRNTWFRQPQWPSYVAWWVQDGHIPQWREGAERHEHLHEHGPSAYAFDFKHPYGPDGRCTEIDQALVKAKMERNARALRSA